MTLQLLTNPRISVALDLLQELGIESYVVGGFVRDFILGREAVDIDLAVIGDSREISIGLARSLGGKSVPLDIERGIYRLILEEKDGQLKVDISAIDGDINSDLSRRDFTIDSMAFPLKVTILDRIKSTGRIDPGSLIDPFHGQSDIKSRTIRAINNNVFINDPIRLLRAFRLSVETGFTIDKDTEKHLQQSSRLINNVAGERIREELLGIFSGWGTREILCRMDSAGLLDSLFPEMTPAKGVEQPGWHVYDVFEHSLVTVFEVERILQLSLDEKKKDALLSSLYWNEEAEKHFKETISHGCPRYALNKLAGLLHDVAKPRTKTLTPDGKAHFYDHTTAGATVSRGIMERFRFSNREIGLVELIIDNHLRPTQMGDGAGDNRPSRKAIYRFFRDTGDAALDILYFSLADYLASKDKEVEAGNWQENVNQVIYILNTSEDINSVTKKSRLLDGHELMREFSLSPGPLVGTLLGKIEEAVALRQISTRDEALNLVKDILKD